VYNGTILLLNKSSPTDVRFSSIVPTGIRTVVDVEDEVDTVVVVEIVEETITTDIGATVGL
jgi:hypothetical protein